MLIGLNDTVSDRKTTSKKFYLELTNPKISANLTVYTCKDYVKGGTLCTLWWHSVLLSSWWQWLQ